MDLRLNTDLRSHTSDPQEVGERSESRRKVHYSGGRRESNFSESRREIIYSGARRSEVDNLFWRPEGVKFFRSRREIIYSGGRKDWKGS